MELWSDDEEIVCVPPGGPRLVGHGKIREVLAKIFANGPIHVRPTQATIAQGSMVSAHSMEVQLIVDQSGQTGVIHMDVSNVYFKGPLGWRLVLHHSSLASEKNAAFDAGSDANPSLNVLH
jgi:ketosteroid isomerase-like protein